ncbi:MAG: ABC transporter ATP-binding protein [Acidimicrobiia bacterium]|nr:MAG: ABC transporter ATP-binding protein [Acidimicrobiia bacterium]
MTTPILTASDVTVQFGGLRACDGVGFEVTRGELFAIIGPNGAGKTSVLNAITGIYRPLQGASIVYCDRQGRKHELIGMKPHRIVRLGIARTFQNLGLFPHLSVLDNLMLGRYIHQKRGVLSTGLFLPAAVREELEQRESVERVIELLEMAEFRWEQVGSLPYGIQKRIELGRVLTMEPDLLLLDEPMAGMSVEEKRDILRFIFEIQRRLGVTVILIEHDMAVVMSVAERILALNFGRPLTIGTPEDVARHPEVVEAYLGANGG